MTIKEQTLSVKKEARSSLWTTGLALFSMFFGAGNLIFPLLIGKSVGGSAWYALAGLGLTAVIVPFLGLAAMVLFQADYRRFFGRIGKVPGLMLLLLLQLILGPFGVIPRLVTLMHAMAKPYLFDMPLWVFSLCAAGLIFLCSFRRNRLIGLLGAILTPVLLLSLVALVAAGLGTGSEIVAAKAPSESFFEGLFGGYNTMDLIAAFLFATVVLPHFQKEAEEELPATRQKSILRKMMFSGAIAAGLLLLTYIGLAWISSYHGASLDGVCPPEELLGGIASKLLGPIGGATAAIAVMTACLTTAMTLASIFADYLRKDLCREKIGPTTALVLTLIATTFFANLGFGGIAAFLGPILQVVYPGLILLTVLNLLYSLYGYSRVKVPVFATFAGAAIYFFSS
jgi:LIVCS family branched-chain amino acid:cation transporter